MPGKVVYTIFVLLQINNFISINLLYGDLLCPVYYGNVRLDSVYWQFHLNFAMSDNVGALGHLVHNKNACIVLFQDLEHGVWMEKVVM